MRLGFLCFIYLALIVGAELTTALLEPLWGVVFYYIILFALIFGSVLLSEHSKYGILFSPSNQTTTGSDTISSEDYFPRKLVVTLALVPLFRVVSLAMPLNEFTQIYSYILVSIPLMIGILVIARILDFKPNDIGLTIHAIPLQLVIAVTGVGFGLIDYLILKPEPLIQAFRWQEMIGPSLILLFATGFVEELAFRGVMQRTAATIGSRGWVIVAVLFAIVQIGQGSVLHCLLAFLVALVWGWTVKKTGSIAGVIISHGLLNIGLYLIFPFVF